MSYKAECLAIWPDTHPVKLVDPQRGSAVWLLRHAGRTVAQGHHGVTNAMWKAAGAWARYFKDCPERFEAELYASGSKPPEGTYQGC